MKQQKIFITGTDTDVGKTFFTSALIVALQAQAKSVMAIKPVAAGCEKIDGEWRNQDALNLIDAMNFNPVIERGAQPELIKYQQVNPITLEHPIAPHLAAQLAGRSLSVELLQQQCNIQQYQQQFILVEGAGGWLVPLNERETLSDFAAAESMQVILVVGLKLGCINHALLTQHSIQASGLKLIGWVANHVDPNMLQQQQNIDSLSERLGCPLLAEIPFISGINPTVQASKCVRIAHLLTH